MQRNLIGLASSATIENILTYPPRDAKEAEPTRDPTHEHVAEVPNRQTQAQSNQLDHLARRRPKAIETTSCFFSRVSPFFSSEGGNKKKGGSLGGSWFDRDSWEIFRCVQKLGALVETNSFKVWCGTEHEQNWIVND